MGKNKEKSSSEIVKKMQKNKDLTEQQGEIKSPKRHAEGHQNNETLKIKNKIRNESDAYYESPPRKKKRKLKASTNDELECMQSENTEEADVTMDFGVESNNKSEEMVKKKQKKPKDKESVKHKTSTNDEMERIQRKKPEKAEITMELDVESSNRSEDLVKKKKKKSKDKALTNDEIKCMQRKKSEKAEITMESEVESSNRSQDLVKKKKPKDKHSMKDKALTNEVMECMQRKKPEKVVVLIESEEESSNRSEELVKKKKKKSKDKENRKHKASTNSNESKDLGKKKTNQMNVAVESETQSHKIKDPNKATEKSRKVSVKQNKKVKIVYRTQETLTVPDVTEENTNPVDSEDLPSPTTGVDIGFRKKRRRKGEPVANEEVLLEQIKEFVPNIDSKEPLNVSKLIKYDLPRYKEFKRKGITISVGRFTVKENARLRKNVEDFLALTGVDSATKLFFTHRFKEEQEHIKHVKKQYKFFERIAEGIPRSCYYIYSRGRRMFDDRQYKGEFSKEELHQLLRLHTLHGSNWKKISELTGRSAYSLQKRFAHLSEKEGSWSTKEVQRLLKAVHDYIVSQLPRGANNNSPVTVSKDTLYSRLPWQNIAEKVKTRSWTKCREKWMFILASKMSSGSIFTEKKALDIKIKLIKAMYETEIEDVAFINWEELAAVIGDVPPAYVQKKWHRMKVCHVPEWQTKCFADIVDFLYEKVLPHLEQKFSEYKHYNDAQLKENQESFLLTDIFQDWNREQNDEDSDDEAEQ
ncbi:transcription termination factor 1-like [Trichomycterus rosablanca]|uniref:transcription termination factor 1-like n=1 Tax=Trichomycterus rosablanca TaxID=2290929 RepID=UPI002F34FC84